MNDPVTQDFNAWSRQEERAEAEAEEDYKHPCDVCDGERSCYGCRFRGTR